MMSFPRKQPRPASVAIIQILMLINLVPIALGFGFAFVRTLITEPSNLISIRSILFFGTSICLLTVFLGYGFGGLVKGKKIGYWLGLSFVAVGIAATMYRLTPILYTALTGPNESAYRRLGYQDHGLMTLDLVVLSVIFVLLIALFLKFLLGRKEKLFFGFSN